LAAFGWDFGPPAKKAEMTLLTEAVRLVVIELKLGFRVKGYEVMGDPVLWAEETRYTAEVQSAAAAWAYA
jgi:hypothetical protein